MTAYYYDVPTAEQRKASRRLLELAQEALDERQHWTNVTIRSELLWIHRQLTSAAHMALASSETYGDAWAEAGTLTIRKYIGLRKMIEHVA